MWLPILAWLGLMWVTVKVVPVAVELAAVEIVNDVALGIAVIVTVLVVGMPFPLTLIRNVKVLVEAVVTVVLPLVVLAMMVEDTPRLTQELFEVWQATQKVGLVETLYLLCPRLGVPATPLTVTLRVKPS